MVREKTRPVLDCPMGCQLQVIIKDGIVEKVTGKYL